MTMKAFVKHKTLIIILIAVLAAVITAAVVLLPGYIRERNAWEQQFRVDKEAEAHGGAVRAAVNFSKGVVETERPEDIKVLLDCIRLVRKNRLSASGHLSGMRIVPVELTFADGETKQYTISMAPDGEPQNPFEEFLTVPYIAEQMNGK